MMRGFHGPVRPRVPRDVLHSRGVTSHMSDTSSPIQIVLPSTSGPRVLGMPIHERNRRVADRVNATLVAQPSEGSALVVQGDVVLERGLFDHLPEADALYRLTSPDDDASVLWGPAKLMAAFLNDESGEVVTRALPEGVLFDASTPALRKSCGRTLLLRTVKPTDGFVSRHFNRYVSRFFSRRFMLMRMRPNHGSFVSFLIGVATAWYLAQPTWLSLAIGGLLFQFASIFDGVDGEMARVSVRDSKFGAKVDTVVDNFTYIACLIGFAVGWMREGIGRLDAILVVGTIIAIVLTLLQVLRFVRRYAPNASFVFLDTCVKRAAANTGLPTLRVASAVFYALRRDLFSVLLMFVAFTGSRQTVLWLAIAGLFVANFTLIVHQRRLVEAATAG